MQLSMISLVGTPLKSAVRSLELFDAWNANQLANNLVTLSYLLWYDILVCMFVCVCLHPRVHNREEKRMSNGQYCM